MRIAPSVTVEAFVRSGGVRDAARGPASLPRAARLSSGCETTGIRTDHSTAWGVTPRFGNKTGMGLEITFAD